jgi:hypothetical protein
MTAVLLYTTRVDVTAERSSRSGAWILTVARCPFCGKRHSHGGGSDDMPDLGARRSHCLTGDGGTSELVVAAAMPAEVVS